MQCEVEALHGYAFPASTVQTVIRIAWPEPGHGAAAGSNEQKSVTVLACRAHVVGWVRLHPKLGALQKAEGNQSAVLYSPFLESRFPGEREAARLEQIFFSGFTEICSSAVVKQGQSRCFQYEVTLPPQLPPSFKGKHFSIAFAIIVETQLEGIGNIAPPPSEAQLPFTVLSGHGSSHEHAVEIYGLSGCLKHNFDSKIHTLEKGRPLSIDEGFVNPDREVQDEETSEGMMQRFMIKRQSDVVACFFFPNAPLRCGEPLIASFDFADATVQCRQVVLSLESEESLSAPFRAEGPSPGFGVTSHVTRQLLTNNAQNSFLELVVPLGAPPSLLCSVGSVQWVLRLQIHLGMASGIECEVLNWSLPVEVLPPLLEETLGHGRVARTELMHA